MGLRSIFSFTFFGLSIEVGTKWKWGKSFICSVEDSFRWGHRSQGWWMGRNTELISVYKNFPTPLHQEGVHSRKLQRLSIIHSDSVIIKGKAAGTWLIQICIGQDSTVAQLRILSAFPICQFLNPEDGFFWDGGGARKYVAPLSHSEAISSGEGKALPYPTSNRFPGWCFLVMLQHDSPGA